MEKRIMAGYFFVDMRDVIDEAKLAEYRNKVLATVERYGGKYLVVGGKVEIVEGDASPVFPVLITFPTLEHAHRWYDSEEYKQIRGLRLSATRGHGVFMESEVNDFVHSA